MSKPRSRSAAIETVARVITSSNGAAKRVSPTRWEWDISGRCEQPKVVELFARPSPSRYAGGRQILVKPRAAHPLAVTLSVQCRRCAACVKTKQALWTARALHEIRNAERTWFVTLTVRPEDQYKFLIRGIARREARSVFDEMTEEEEFEVRAREVGAEVTKALKRLRRKLQQGDGVVQGNAVSRPHNCIPPHPSFKYLLAFERHKSGLPHVHALVHETGTPIKKQQLEREWPFGFTHIKLVDDDPRAAFYVAKYLAKAQLGRVRASLAYGRSPTPTSVIGLRP